MSTDEAVQRMKTEREHAERMRRYMEMRHKACRGQLCMDTCVARVRVQALVEFCCDLHWDYDPDSGLTVFSDEYGKRTGHEKLVYEKLDDVLALVHPQDRENFSKLLLTMAQGGKMRFDCEVRWLFANGEYHWFAHRGVGLRDESGKVDHIMALVDQVDERRLQEEILKEDRIRNRLLLQAAASYIWEFDVASRVFALSKQLNDFLGQNERGKSTLPDFITKEDLAVREGTKIEKCIRARRGNGMDAWFSASYFRVKDPKGGPGKLVGILNDISNQKQREEDMACDPLTGAHNRRKTTVLLEQAFSDFMMTRACYGIVFADLDYFKRVNDTYGHLAGDAVLREVVETLSAVPGTFPEVCRWGGEEFLILCESFDERELEEYAEALRRAVEQHPVAWEGQEIRITLSVGVSVFDEDDYSYDDAVGRADRGVYIVKGEGKNAAYFYKAHERRPITIK